MDRWDCLFLLGLVVAGAGLWLWLHPGAGLVLVGGVICWIAYRGAPVSKPVNKPNGV